MYFTYIKEDSIAPIAVIVSKSQNKPQTRKYIYYTETESEHTFRELRLSAEQKKTSEIIPIWFKTKNQRTCVNISAKSGAGKSVLLAKMLKEFLKLYGKEYQQNWLFTTASETDPAFKGLKLPRVDLEFAMDHARLEDVKDSVVVYDDAAHSGSKELDEWLFRYMLQILEKSRKLNACFVSVNHDTRAGNATKLLNLECDAYVCFNQTNLNATVKLLKNYLDFDKQQIDMVKKVNNGRFTYLYISKLVPYLISQDRLIFYQQFE